MAGEHIVLVVDDNGSVRGECVRLLRGAGFQALEAASLAQAKRLLAAPISAVLVADKLADGTAVELIRSLQLPSLVLSSTPSSMAAAEAISAGASGSVNRQRPADGLLPALKRALGETSAAQSSPLKAPKRASNPAARPVAEPRRVSAESAAATDDAAAKVLLGALEKELAFLKTAGHYRVLGVRGDASVEDIRAAFEKFKAKWHPTRMSDDATPAMRALAAEIFALGQQAFAVLSDDEKRAAYKPPPTLVPKSKKRAPQPTPSKVAKPAEPPAEPPADGDPIDIFAAADLPPMPKDEDPDLHEAREKLRKGDASGANGALQKHLTFKPQSRPASALAHVAKAIEKGLDEETASRELEQALADDPNCVEALAVKEGLAQKRAAVLDRISTDKISRKALTEAAVLAFSNSLLSEVVGTDALRTAINARYKEMVAAPGAVDLGPLWDILTAQPGFDADKALPPLCRIKIWEREIGGEIKLPAAVGNLSMIEQHKHAANCKVADEALTRAVLAASGAAAPASPPPRSIGSAANIQVTATETVTERKKRGLAMYLVAAAVIVVTASAIYTFGTNIKSLEPSAITQAIPAKEARRSGECVGLVLSDPGWLTIAKDTREKQVEEALDRARAQGAGSLVVIDGEDRIVAQATFADGRVTVQILR
jgi:DNA-binding NarL/FixJ family response regulator